jgi:hypothetical protein
MFPRTFGIAAVGFVLCLFGIQIGIGAKDKDKFEIPKNAITGTVKSVDEKASTFTITLKDAKDRTFKVDDKTEFWGPKGGDRGTGPKGLKDDCMAKGYEIRVMPRKDGMTAKDVFLPNRKSDDKK